MLVEFCIPVFNEESLLKKNVLTLWQFFQKQEFDFDWRIVILVNGSSDSSASIASQLEKEYSKISCVIMKQGGKGRALKEYGKTATGDLFFYMDIDLAISPRHIPQFLNILIKEGDDIIIGSRLLPDSRTERSWPRELSSRVYSWASGLLLKDGIRDRQCGFKVIKTRVLQAILPYVVDDHWFFDTELVAQARHKGYGIKEMPVDWEENRYDKRESKIKLTRDSHRFIVNLFQLKRRLKQNNRKNN